MCKFVLNISKFLLLLFILINILFLFAGRKNYFIGGIIKKHELLENKNSPRIILIGGSGVGQSIDSKLIFEKTGKNVINMGLFAQFGLRYLLEEVMDDIRKDDIIIVIPEYQHFYYFFDGWRGLNELIYVYPKSMKYISSFNQVKVIINTYPRFFIGKLNSLNINIFKKKKRNKLYNEFGDHIFKLDTNKVYDIENLNLFHDFIDSSSMRLNKNVIPILNNFSKDIENKGANFYFVYPTIPEKQFYESYSSIKIVKDALNKFAKFEILNQPKSDIQSTDNFYNAVYHLNREGIEVRTKKLISYIQITQGE